MSELVQYYNEFACSSAWMAEDARECGCRGSGWWSSQVDTWHRCSIHGTAENARHPEEEDDAAEFIGPVPYAPPLVRERAPDDSDSDPFGLFSDDPNHIEF